MPSLDILLEAERRGILPADKKVLLDEARSRGLVPRNPQTITAPTTPPFLEQLAEPFTRALSTTGKEITEGLSQAFTPPVPVGGIQGGINSVVGAGKQLLGLGRAAVAPITGFVYEPLKRTAEAVTPRSVPAPIREALAETAGLAGSMFAPTPLQMARLPTLREAAYKLGQKEGTRGIISAQQAAREAAMEAPQMTLAAEEAARRTALPGVESEAALVRGSAEALGKQADEATRALEIARQESAQAKGLKAARQAVPEPPPLPPTDPFTAQAVAELQQFPLRTTPTPTSLTEAGVKYVGTPGSPGLFRTAAKGIKDKLTQRLNDILPEDAVAVVSPIEDAAQSILPKKPEQVISGIETPPQRIAAEIDRIVSSNLTQLDKGEQVALTLQKMIRERKALGQDVKLGELVDLAKTASTGKTFIESGIGSVGAAGQPAALPSLRDIHFDRTMIRAMGRAADKAGHGILVNQLGTLERGYTKAINESLGPEGAAALRAWDKDYAYGVQNLFGYNSLPYKLSGKNADDAALRAERFSDLLFKRTGAGENTRVQRVMELLGPEQKKAMGETFLQTVSKKSQTPQMPFDPQKWGKEYLAYKDQVKEAVLSPEHKKALDDIATMFVQTPLRQQQATLARQAAVDLRQQGIAQAGQVLREATAVERATQQRLQGLTAEHGQIPILKQYATELESEMKRLAQPTAAEKQAMGQIKELQKPTIAETEGMKQLERLNEPGGFTKFLNRLSPYAQHRLMWGAGALAIGHSIGAHHILEAGGIILGAESLRALLSNDRGARLARILVKERPGTENALRATAGAVQVLREIGLEPSE